jgi:hypothetical protein
MPEYSQDPINGSTPLLFEYSISFFEHSLFSPATRLKPKLNLRLIVGQFGLAELAPLQAVDFANSKLTHHPQIG